MSVSVTTRPIEPVTGTKWSCAHLPIMYELTNNYFPVNSADTTRTISSEANDNGFMQLNLSGSLGTFEALDYVSISGADIPDGNYQIIAKGSTSQITINYPYESITNTGNVVLYRNNYHILVQVWCGLKSTHIHQALKPYELAATLKFVPDSGNDIVFSINEIVKAYIELNNDLQLSTLPNNIDFMSMFYIKYAESYDVSDGDVVTTYTSSYIDDSGTLEGLAVQSKLPFKNDYSGWMTEYIGSSRKFLTLFNELYLYPSNYMDVGFIIDEAVTSAYFVVETYLLGERQDSTFAQSLVVTNNYGVFRKELAQVDDEDEQIIYLASGAGIDVVTDSSTWTSPSLFGSGNAFDDKTGNVFTQNVMVNFNDYTAEQSVSIPSGEKPLSINAITTIASLNPSDTISVMYYFLDVSHGIVGSTLKQYTADGVYNETIDFQALSGAAAYFAIDAFIAPSVGGASIAINIPIGQVLYVSESDAISETKTVNIVSDCYDQSLNITWLNYEGGFDYHVFTTRKTYSIETTGTKTQKKNIFNGWPDSYGSSADTINRVTKRDSVNIIEITSQFVTVDQEDAIKYIMTSPLVQIINSTSDRRTVIVRNTTLPIRRDQDKLRKLSFTLEYTDEIPSQSI